MHHKAVAILERLPDAPVRLSYALANLAISEHKLGDNQASIAAFQRALDLSIANEGADHPHVADLLAALSDPMGTVDPAKAHDLLTQALAIRRAKLGDGPETADAIGMLADQAYEADELAEASKLLDEAIAMYEATGTTALARYALYRGFRGKVRLALHRYADAVTDLTAGRDAQLANGNPTLAGRDALDLAMAQWGLGTAAARQDAIASAQSALDLATQADDDDTTAAATRWLAAHPARTR